MLLHRQSTRKDYQIPRQPDVFRCHLPQRQVAQALDPRQPTEGVSAKYGVLFIDAELVSESLESWISRSPQVARVRSPSRRRQNHILPKCLIYKKKNPPLKQVTDVLYLGGFRLIGVLPSTDGLHTRQIRHTCTDGSETVKRKILFVDVLYIKELTRESTIAG